MPNRNRVTPWGEIEAIPLRGAWTGNRGVLHRGHEIVRQHAGDLWITCELEFRGRWREQWIPHRYTHLLRGAWTGNRGVLHRGHEIVRQHAGDLWITCELEFRGRWREQWIPHRYTHLYFHDEAVSFAAGHRPCAECRRASYNAYRYAWSDELHVELPSAKDMNRRLHGERLVAGTRQRRIHLLPWPDLPDGTFVTVDNTANLVIDGHLVEWTRDGYGARHTRPTRGDAQVITPPATIAVLRAGYPVQIDDTARFTKRNQ